MKENELAFCVAVYIPFNALGNNMQFVVVTAAERSF